MFDSVAMEDVYNCSIVQQCRMLEAEQGTNVLALCLNDPVNDTQTVLNNKEQLLKKDFSNLLISAKGSAHMHLVPALPPNFLETSMGPSS